MLLVIYLKIDIKTDFCIQKKTLSISVVDFEIKFELSDFRD